MTDNVYLFVPNLIGYARVILAFLAFYWVEDTWICMGMYFLSAILDVADGYAARALGQSSRFGALLDMVTDRCATTCLLLTLAGFYPQYALLFQFLLSLDISSHYIHMYSSLLGGSESHKKISEDANKYLRLYYTSRTVLFWMCAGNELFFIALFIISRDKGPLVIPQLNIHAFEILALVSFPVCFLKQVINVIQFKNAANHLVSIDVAERKNKKGESGKGQATPNKKSHQSTSSTTSTTTLISKKEEKKEKKSQEKPQKKSSSEEKAPNKEKKSEGKWVLVEKENKEKAKNQKANKKEKTK